MQRPRRANLSALSITADGSSDIKLAPAYSRSSDRRYRQRFMLARAATVVVRKEGGKVQTQKSGTEEYL